jgi:O-antigen ligase
MGLTAGVYILVTVPGVKPLPRLVGIVVGGIGMLGMAFLFAILNPERFSIAAIFSDRGAGRLDIWNAAIQVMEDHWIFGLGMGGFASNAIQFMQVANNGDITLLSSEQVIAQGGINAHNVYLALVLDSGIIGLVLYLTIIAGVLKNLWDLRRNPRWADLSWAFTGIVLVNLVGGMLGGALNGKFFWTIAGASAGYFVRRRLTPRRGSRPAVAPSASVGTGG